MTTRLGSMASRAFEPDSLEIPEVGVGKRRGSKPQITGTIVVPSWTDDEPGPVTASKEETRGVNPSMAKGVCLFSKSNDPKSMGDSTISLMTIEKEGARVTWPRRFSKYSPQSFLDPTDIAL